MIIMAIIKNIIFTQCQKVSSLQSQCHGFRDNFKLKNRNCYFNHCHFKSLFLFDNDQDKHKINWKSCPHIAANITSFTFSGFQVVEMLEGPADVVGCPIDSAPRSSLYECLYERVFLLLLFHDMHNDLLIIVSSSSSL